MKKILSILCILSCTAGIASCSSTAYKGEKISVYASFYAMYDFAREIGGDRINIYNICPTGTEPHDFEPTAADMAKITEADVFIYNGLGMESWTDSVMEIVGGTDVITINTSENVPAILESHDAHIWLNPDNAYAQMEAIADGFIKADPENEDYYNERLAECKTKIDTLTADYSAAAAEFTTTDVIVSHEAYFSLCNAFNLTQIPLNGPDNAHDPTPARLAEITDYIKTNNIKYIFTEPLGSSSVVDSVANDTGCGTLVLDPFEGSTENKDYFTVMYENLESLKTALTGGSNGSNKR